MQSSLDMPLDDLIRQSKKPLGGHRYSGRFSGPGPDRRFLNRAPGRIAPYSAGPPEVAFSGGDKAPMATKLYISNLDYDVSNDDIKVLFSEVGELKHHSIHYDRSGRSKGTAEVVFVHHSDALAAIKRYNNVQLDGKPLKIELVGQLDAVTQPDLPPTGDGILGFSLFQKTGDGILGKPNAALLSVYGHGKAGIRVPTRGGTVGSGHGRARGPQQRKNNDVKMTAQDLDAELERYHLEALRIN